MRDAIGVIGQLSKASAHMWDVANGDGQTPLEMVLAPAEANGKQMLEVYRILIDAGKGQSGVVVDSADNTLLHYASRQFGLLHERERDSVELEEEDELEKRKEDLIGVMKELAAGDWGAWDEMNDRGETPWKLALGNTGASVFEVLVDAIGDTIVADGVGNTLLHYAALEFKDLQESRGDTVMVGRMVSVLEKLGAVSEAWEKPNEDGQTAWDLVQQAVSEGELGDLRRRLRPTWWDRFVKWGKGPLEFFDSLGSVVTTVVIVVGAVVTFFRRYIVERLKRVVQMFKDAVQMSRKDDGRRNDAWESEAMSGEEEEHGE